MPNDNQPPRQAARLIARTAEDRFKVVAIGRGSRWVTDFYARLLDAPWRTLFFVVGATYLAINGLFAALYYIGGDVIENARPEHPSDVFFFSVQTFATIGYGKMAPDGIYANILVTIEAFMGFMFYAVTTGLVFSKFSRPTARVLFSNVAVIAPYHGVPHLMIRMANERRNRIADANAQLVLWQEEDPGETTRPRRFIDLPLVRQQVPLLQLVWTIMHRIDEDSPLYGQSLDMLKTFNSELIVSLTGIDETLAQPVHTRFSYLPDEVLFNQAFEEVIERYDHRVEIHYDRFHLVRPVAALRSVKPLHHAQDDPALTDLMKICSPQNFPEEQPKTAKR